MKRIIVAVLLVLSLCSCANRANRAWYQQGKTCADYKHDLAQCEYETMSTSMIAQSRGASGLIQSNILLHKCLAARGWTLADFDTARANGCEGCR
jgi:hypothetical protein